MADVISECALEDYFALRGMGTFDHKYALVFKTCGRRSYVPIFLSLFLVIKSTK